MVLLTDRATAAALAAVSLVTLVCAILTWRRRLRADGILSTRETRASRRRTRDTGAEPAPDPTQVLSDLRVLLASMMAESAGSAADGRGPAAVTIPAPRNEPAPGSRAGAEPGTQPKPGGQPEPGTQDEPGGPAEPGQNGLAAMEPMLAGAELLMVGCGEEEAW